MTLPRTLLAIALLVVAVNVAEARAAAPWVAPVAVPGSDSAFAHLTFAPGTGVGFVGWSGNSALPRPGDVSGAPVTPDGTPGAARKLVTGMLATHFRGYGANRMLAVGARYIGKPRPYWSLGRTSGTLGRLRPFPGVRHASPFGLAVNAKGTAVAALGLCTGSVGCGRAIPGIAIRRAGARDFSRPIHLFRAPVTAMAVDINDRGDILAVWDRPLNGSFGRRGIWATIRTARGKLRTERLGTSEPVPRLSAAIGADRRAIVGWLGQRIGEGTPHSPATIQVSSAAPGRGFGVARRLEVVPNLGTGRYVGQAGVRVDIARDGREVVAWTGYRDGRFVVRANAGQVISDPAHDTVLGDLATGAAGEAVAILHTGIGGADPSGPGGVHAATRAPGEKNFGALEEIAAPAGFREAADAEIVPTNGRVVVVWRDVDARSVQIASRPTLAPGAHALPGA